MRTSPFWLSHVREHQRNQVEYFCPRIQQSQILSELSKSEIFAIAENFNMSYIVLKAQWTLYVLVVAKPTKLWSNFTAELWDIRACSKTFYSRLSGSWGWKLTILRGHPKSNHRRIYSLWIGPINYTIDTIWNSFTSWSFFKFLTRAVPEVSWPCFQANQAPTNVRRGYF
jgi:hypothetical protein